MIEDEAIAEVRRDGLGRQKSCAVIAAELSLSGPPFSAATVRRILRRADSARAKPPKKPEPGRASHTT